MTDEKPRKTLSLKRRKVVVEPQGDVEVIEERPQRTLRNRLAVERENMKAGGGRAGDHRQRGKSHRNSRSKPAKPELTPSEEMLRALNDHLKKLQVWRNHLPLAIGADQQVIDYAEGKVETSKRVLKKLLHRHTRHNDYLKNVSRGGQRFNLDCSRTGEISESEVEHANRAIKAKRQSK